jgi:hypothetical protein
MTDTCTFLIYRWNDEGGLSEGRQAGRQAAAASSIVQRIHLTQLKPFFFICPAPMPSFPKA